MSVFRIQLADGEKILKADLKAFNEDGGPQRGRKMVRRRSLADRWYSAIGPLNSVAVGLRDRPETTNDTVAIVSEITAGFKARLEYVLD
jgi:hypothetical protein